MHYELLGSFLLGFALLVLTDPRVARWLLDPDGSLAAASVRQRLARQAAKRRAAPRKAVAPHRSA